MQHCYLFVIHLKAAFLLIRNKEQKRARYPQMVSNTDRIQIVKSVHLTSLLNFEWLTIENLKFSEIFFTIPCFALQVCCQNLTSPCKSSIQFTSISRFLFY